MKDNDKNPEEQLNIIHNEAEQRLSMLEDKYSTLETIMFSVKTTANLVLGLSVAIAIINFFITLGGVLIGCGCIHVNGFNNVNNSNLVWTIISCILAGLVMIASFAIACIGYVNEKKHNAAGMIKINKLSIILIIASFTLGFVGLLVSVLV